MTNNSLWVFGPSVAQEVDNEEQWTKQIADKLNLNLKSYALSGSSIEFLYDRFNYIRDSIKENDTLLLIFPTANRRWFYKDRPDCSILLGSPTDQEYKAIDLYRKYLDSIEIHQIYFVNFLYNVHALTKKLNLKTIAIVSSYELLSILDTKNFPLFSFSKGSLVELSIEEIEESFLKEKTMDWIGQYDPRLNHMCKSNHDILANKIIDNILYNTPIDLTVGFHKSILSTKNLNDNEFVKQELFDNAMTKKIYNKHWSERIKQVYRK